MKRTNKEIVEAWIRSKANVNELIEAFDENDAELEKNFISREKVEELIGKLKYWCICGHRIDEHGRDNNPNLCAGCPCEEPTPLWHRIIDVDEIKKLLSRPKEQDERLESGSYKMQPESADSAPEDTSDMTQNWGGMTSRPSEESNSPEADTKPSKLAGKLYAGVATEDRIASQNRDKTAEGEICECGRKKKEHFWINPISNRRQECLYFDCKKFIPKKKETGA